MVFNNQVGSVEALFGADADTVAQARAEYVYSAYGEVMMKSGDLADKNNITYSTRYQEANTGLVSYTYRHYSPRLKKWINKDPIAEQGGINLYQMVSNQPINYWDLLGKSINHIGNLFSGISSFLQAGMCYSFTGLLDPYDIEISYYLPFVIPDYNKKIKSNPNIENFIKEACASKSSKNNNFTLSVKADGPYYAIVGNFSISGKVKVNYNKGKCTWTATGRFGI